MGDLDAHRVVNAYDPTGTHIIEKKYYEGTALKQTLAESKDGSTNLTFDTNKEGAGSHFLITLGNSPRGSAGAEDTGGSLSHEIIHGLGVTDTKEYTSGKLSSYSTDRSLQSSEVIQMIQPAMQFAKENNIKNGSVLITHSRGSKPRDYPIQLK